MLFVAEMNRGNDQLALLFDVGLIGSIDHDVADFRVAEQLFERPETQKFVNQHFFQRKLLAPVEGQFEFGEHFANDRAEFLGQFVFGQG